MNSNYEKENSEISHVFLFFIFFMRIIFVKERHEFTFERTSFQNAETCLHADITQNNDQRHFSPKNFNIHIIFHYFILKLIISFILFYFNLSI